MRLRAQLGGRRPGLPRECPTGGPRSLIVAAMMSGDYEGSIHDLPEGASVLVGAHGEPTAIYWPEELTEEERLREEEEGGPLAEQDDPADWAQSEN